MNGTAMSATANAGNGEYAISTGNPQSNASRSALLPIGLVTKYASSTSTSEPTAPHLTRRADRLYSAGISPIEATSDGFRAWRVNSIRPGSGKSTATASTGTAAATPSIRPARRQPGANSTRTAAATPRKSAATGLARPLRAAGSTDHHSRSAATSRSAPIASATPTAKVIRPASRFVVASRANATPASSGRSALRSRPGNRLAETTVATAPTNGTDSQCISGGTITL